MAIDTFRIARKSDADAIAQLVNNAYRPEPNATGWTHEAHLVSGSRTHAGHITKLLGRPDSVILVGLKKSELVACAHIEKAQSHSRIGMLAVCPLRQGLGLGKQMLTHAEKYAHACFNSEKFILQVISARSELIAFYLRRGYQKTGEILAFPHSADVGTPITPDIHLEILEKYTHALANVPMTTNP
jgi:GNAT superfamily N-acetyltransferase